MLLGGKSVDLFMPGLFNPSFPARKEMRVGDYANCMPEYAEESCCFSTPVAATNNATSYPGRIL
jgi:hypothetical protein